MSEVDAARLARLRAEAQAEDAEAKRREAEAKKLDNAERPSGRGLRYRLREDDPLLERLVAGGVDPEARSMVAETVGWIAVTAEDRAWLAWGEGLWERFCPKGGKVAPVSWTELRAFVIDFAWLNSAFLEAIAKPCWTLHPEVVEAVTMLFLGRKSYEESRAEGCRVGEHSAFLDLRDRCVAEITEGLKHCEVSAASVGPGPEYRRGLWCRHSSEGAKRWVGFVLTQVEFEGAERGVSPQMDVARDGGVAAEGELDGELGDEIGEPLPQRTEPRPERGTALGR